MDQEILYVHGPQKMSTWDVPVVKLLTLYLEDWAAFYNAFSVMSLKVLILGGNV